MDAPPTGSANQILAEHHGRFFDFLRRRLASDAVAEDILQDAYAKSLEKADETRGEDSVVAWFYQILRNAVVDHYRKAGIEQRAYDRLERETEEAFEPELRNNVCTCVSAVFPASPNWPNRSPGKTLHDCSRETPRWKDGVPSYCRPRSQSWTTPSAARVLRTAGCLAASTSGSS